MKSQLGAMFQLAILTGPSDQTARLSEMGSIEWLFCKNTSEHIFEFYQGDVIVSSVNLERPRFDLHNLLGIIVVGDADKFDAIKSAWASALPSLKIVFRRVSKFDSTAILCAALDCVAEDLALHRKHSGRAALELATYRGEFDRLQRCFSRVEEYISRQSLGATIETFEYPADSRSVTKESGWTESDAPAAANDHSLTQYLPVDSLGFSSFAIYIGERPRTASDPLRITLKAVETGQQFGAWSLNAADTPVGWVELALNSSIDESALSLLIIVKWPPNSKDWALALGPPHPYQEFCARTEAGHYLGAPLALRAFSRLPGVRIPTTTSARRPDAAPHTLTQFIPYEIYATVAQVFPRAEAGTWVSYDANSREITVHPVRGGVLTVGRMTVTMPQHAWGISAQIQLAHDQAHPTEFGLMVCASSDKSRESERLDQLNSISDGFSGWKTLAPLEKKSLSVLIPGSTEGRLSIYLLTRQAPDAPQEYAWARFSSLAFHILPKSVISGNDTGLADQVLRTSARSEEAVRYAEELKIVALRMEPDAKPL